MKYEIVNHQPKEQCGAPCAYPFGQLQAGQSFFVPMVGRQTPDMVRCNVHGAARIFFGEAGRIKTREGLHNGEAGIWVWIKVNSPLKFRTRRKPKPETREVKVFAKPSWSTGGDAKQRRPTSVTLPRAEWESDEVKILEAEK